MTADVTTATVATPLIEALPASRAKLLRQSYLCLSISVASACAGGLYGSNSATVIEFFGGWIGWIVAMLLINFIPVVAMKYRHDAVLGPVMLVLDGFVSGLVLAPMLAYAAYWATGDDIVGLALLSTFGVFAVVSVSVWMYGEKITFPKLLIPGLAAAVLVSLVASALVDSGSFWSPFIAMGITGLGVFQLAKSSSALFASEEIDSPIAGALELFAGVFNIFVGILSLLSSDD